MFLSIYCKGNVFLQDISKCAVFFFFFKTSPIVVLLLTNVYNHILYITRDILLETHTSMAAR